MVCTFHDLYQQLFVLFLVCAALDGPGYPRGAGGRWGPVAGGPLGCGKGGVPSGLELSERGMMRRMGKVKKEGRELDGL